MISIPVIRRHLTSDLLGRHIYLFGEGASEAVLRRLADAGAQEGTVVLAEDETHVHAAALFRPVLQPGAVETFGSITTLALAEAIEAVEGTGPIATPIWPDRVEIDDTTVGTSSVEVATATERPDFVILGVSVSIQALEAAARRPYDPNALIAAWLNGLDRWSTTYAARGPATVAGAVRFRPRGTMSRREPSPGRV